MNRKPNFLNVLVSVLVGMTLLLSAAQPNLVSASTELGGGDGVRTSIHPQTGKLSFLGADPSSPIRVDAAMRADLSAEGRGMAILDVYGPQFGLKNPQEELRLKSTREAEGRGMTKYQQLYQGIPVMAGELIVNTNAQGALVSINGEVSPDLDISVTPSIDASQAQGIALQEIASAYGLFLSDVVASEPELWIYDARLMNGEDATPAHLVWRMEITSENAPLRELVLVNAQTGKISLHFNQIDTAWSGE
jgi:Zn-dependent metalloprotease